VDQRKCGQEANLREIGQQHSTKAEPNLVHFSGIVVATKPGTFTAVCERLDALPGVEVHLRFAEEGRVIVVQETRTLDAQKEGLKRFQGLDDVLFAELSYYRSDAASALDV